jgi:cytoskeletal protein RodZ
MQHLDDAQIAEYLDGETAPEPIDRHLAECATCRSRVDAERTVHTRAAGILEDGGPGAVVAPSFDEVLIRAGRKPATRRPRMPLRALAWAATIVLAFGAGWMLRRPGTAPTSAAPPTVQGIVANAPAPSATAPSAAAAKPVAPSPQASEAPKQAEGSEKSAAAGPPPPPAPNGVFQAKPAAPPALANPPTARRADASVALEANGARDVVAQAAGGVAAEGLALKSTTWLPVGTKGEAAGRLGANVAVVQGLDARYAVSRVPPVSVRVEQPLGDGATLVLIERRVAGDTALVMAPRRVAADSGFVAMELMRKGTLIRASAPVSSDSLLALLRRLD